MSDIHVVRRERHATKYWQRYRSYAHAAGDALAPLVLAEMPRACTAMPIGFVDAGDSLAAVAVQGVEPGRNLFVDQEGGWLADYIPAAYRSYPFVLGAGFEAGPVLCVIEDSGLVSDEYGEPFFDEQAELAPSLKDVLHFMTRVTGQRQATRRTCEALKKHGLLQSWPFKHKTNAGERVIEGLYRIDRQAMQRLSPSAFQALRLAGALPAVYCHLISMQHMPKLARWAQSRADGHAGPSLSPNGDLDIDFLSRDSTIAFGALDQHLMHSQEVSS